MSSATVAPQPWSLSDLVVDSTNGRLSYNKLWANIAYAVVTFAIIRLSIVGEVSIEMWLVYLGAVAGNATICRVLSLRFRKGAEPAEVTS